MTIFSAQLKAHVKPVPKAFSRQLPYPPFMDDIFQIRRRNMALILDMPKLRSLRKKVDKAVTLGLSASMFSQLVSPGYRIGKDMARKVETRLGLTTDWMDHPHGSEPLPDHDFRQSRLERPNPETLLLAAIHAVAGLGLVVGEERDLDITKLPDSRIVSDLYALLAVGQEFYDGRNYSKEFYAVFTQHLGKQNRGSDGQQQKGKRAHSG